MNVFNGKQSANISLENLYLFKEWTHCQSAHTLYVHV